MEDPIDAIKAGPDDTAGTGDDYTNLIAQYQGTYAYSYVFDGQAGYLDHALASASLLAQVTGAADWHINADEPDVLDYDTSLQAAGPGRALRAERLPHVRPRPGRRRARPRHPDDDDARGRPDEPAVQRPVDLTATITPAEATGSVQFQKSVSGGAFADIGSPVSRSGGIATLADVQILDAAGTDVVFRARFDGTNDYVDSEGTASLAVTHEDASILYNAANPVAIQVDAPGSGWSAGSLSLTIGVKEKEPDVAGTGTTGIGDISLAGLSVKLVPLAAGGSIPLTCDPDRRDRQRVRSHAAFTCSRAGAIALGTYEVAVTVDGAYYTGSYTDAFTVFDPSLGFATGGGRFVHDGDDTTFGFVMTYTKKGTNLKGNLIVVRHHDDGTVSRLKSNSLGGLAILDSNGCGIATFSGKATYTTWDPTANGGLGAYVTTGNNSFSVRADDCNNPGTGNDAIWVGGPGNIGMMSPASSHLATLTGGNIAVPHKPAK